MWLVLHEPKMPTDHELEYQNIEFFKKDITFFSNEPKEKEEEVLKKFKMLQKKHRFWYQDAKLFYVESF